MMKEIWKDVFSGHYQVSNLGRVRRMSVGGSRTDVVGRILVGGLNKKGYRHVTISIGGGQKTVKVHKLVIETFIGPCPAGKEVNHKDGVKVNCRLSNLEYKTHKGNIAHAIRLGLRDTVGEENGNAKLTRVKVRRIRYFASSLSRRALARRFRISLGAVQDIMHRRSWKNLN
jgi:HNH endonuclease/NUMOD4 motif